MSPIESSCDDTLRRRLADLVAFDTQNPGGDEAPMVAKLAADLHGLGATSVETFQAGSHHAVFAKFGAAPRILLNAHVDTVPANSGYTAPPLTLLQRGGRLVGLGAADTKGAIAAILEALSARAAAGRASPAVAVLFSGDEEAAGSTVRAFLASERTRGIERAIVCEPTACHAGTRHRGIGAARVANTSPGGHSSRADELPAPVAVVARAAVALESWGRRRRRDGPPPFQGLCVNIAAIQGGVAFNVIPTRAVLTFSFRPWPGADMARMHREAEAEARAAAAPDDIDWQIILSNPPFATRDVAGFAPWLGDGVRAPADLQFWTEAALFSEAGIDSVVFGPGDVGQAHAPDEYVELAQLVAARDAFIRVLS